MRCLEGTRPKLQTPLCSTHVPGHGWARGKPLRWNEAWGGVCPAFPHLQHRAPSLAEIDSKSKTIVSLNPRSATTAAPCASALRERRGFLSPACDGMSNPWSLSQEHGRRLRRFVPKDMRCRTARDKGIGKLLGRCCCVHACCATSAKPDTVQRRIGWGSLSRCRGNIRAQKYPLWVRLAEHHPGNWPKEEKWG